MEVPKIQLSESELTLACNAQVILTKNTVIGKTINLLDSLLQQINTQYPSAAFRHLATTPKISKGENYRGLPYVVLDYPRISEQENLLFIRSMFWWGHHFSSTLQVTGEYKHRLESALQQSYPALLQRDYYLAIHQDPWRHDLSAETYRQVRDMSAEAFGKRIRESSYVKLAAFWPLSDWNNVEMSLLESWKFLFGLVA
jgi:hypothetical protein